MLQSLYCNRSRFLSSSRSLRNLFFSDSCISLILIFLFFFRNLACDLSLCLKNYHYELFCHMYLYECCQLDLASYLVPLLLVLEYIVEKKFSTSALEIHLLLGCVHI